MNEVALRSHKYSVRRLENLFVTARREFKYQGNVFMTSLINYDVIQNGVLTQRSGRSRIFRILQ